MKKKTPNKAPMAKLTPASAARIRAKANKVLGVKGDKDSAAGAAT
jgi:hypothetical protein